MNTKSNNLKKFMAIFLVTIMIFGVTACGSSNQTGQAQTTTQASSAASTGTAPADKQKEPVTIQCLIPEPGSAEWNDFANSPVQQEIKRATGVTLEIVDGDENKYNVILASGDIPDMIRAKPSFFKQLIEGGNVIPLDDLLRTNGQEILKSVPQTVDFSKKFWSNGTNKLYFIPAQVGADAMGLEASMGATIRWDYYKELGYPEMKNEDDLLNVISQMVQKHPKTDDGKKVYGVGAFNDSGLWCIFFTMASLYGYAPLGTTCATQIDTNEPSSLTDNLEGPFWKSVSFYYKANKLGLLDPDAMTMKTADFTAKCTNGQLVYAPSSGSTGDFNGMYAKDGKGFMTIPLDAGYQWNGANYTAGWTDKSYGISKSSKNADRAMDLLNYFWSYDGARTLYSGVKGTHWDLTDGKPALKEGVIKLRSAGGDEWKKTGIQFNLNLIGMSSLTINPADNAPLNLFSTEDIYAASLNPLQKDFSDHYGVKYPAEAFKKRLDEGKNKNQKNQNTIAAAIMQTAPDDIKRMEAKVFDLLIKDSAKCILSKSDSEYQQNQAKAIEEFKAAGGDKVAEWYKKAWNDAVAQSGF